MVCLLLVDSFTYPGCLRPGSSGSPGGSDNPGYLSPDHPHPGSATHTYIHTYDMLGGIDVSQVGCAYIMKVCMHRRAGSTIYVCMHAYIHVLCMYVCIYAIWCAIRRADRWYICVSNMHVS